VLSEKEFEERLISFKAKIAKISSNSLVSGRHPSKFLGTGDKMKDYGEYDPAIHEISDIDFVLSACEPDGKLWVKYFFDEEVRPTFIVIDTTESMYFGDKLDAALLAAWFLAASLVADGPVYLVDCRNLAAAVKKIPQTVLKKSIAELRKSYEKQVELISKEILGLKRDLKKEKNKTGGFNYSDLALFFKKKVRKSNLFVVSDFISNEDFSDIFQKLKSSGFSVFVVIVRDEEEENPRNLGALNLRDPEKESGRNFFGSLSKVKKFIGKKNSSCETDLLRSSAPFVRISCIDELLVKIRLLLKKAKKI